MSFAFPLALWLATLAALVFLARRRRPVDRVAVAALHLWATASARDANPVARRLRRHWLAVLQAALVIAIAVAIAGPRLSAGTAPTALIIDNSLSMSARSGGSTRLALAAARADAWLAALPRRTRVRLVTAAPTPRDIGEFDASSAALRAAIAAVVATDGGARLADALGFAASTTPAPARMLVVTDRPSPGHDASVEWVAVGDAADNVAVRTLRAARVHAADAGADVLVDVWNYGRTATTRTLVVTHDGRELARRALTLGARSGIAVTLPTTGAGRVTAAIDGSDAIAGDDSRSALVPPALSTRVAFIGADRALERALRSRRGLDVRAGEDPAAEIVVCAGCATPPAGGHALLLVPSTDRAATRATLHVRDRQSESGPRIGPWLDGIEVVAIPGPPAPDDAIVATAGALPAILAYESGGRRVIELRVDLARSSLPLSPAFPMLMAHAVDWLSGRDAEAASDVAASLGDDESDAIPAAATAEATAGAAAGGLPGSPALPPRDVTIYILATALALLAIEWRLRPGPWRSRRGVAALLLGAALAGAGLPWAASRLDVMFALDVSDSMTPRRAAALGALASSTARMHAADRAGLVVFGTDAIVERRLEEATLGATAPTTRTASSGTSLEAALRTARAALGREGGRRIVLISDGRQTTGDVRAETAAAKTQGIAIDVLAPRARSVTGPAASVVRLAGPPTVHVAEPFEVIATVEGAPGEATVALQGGETTTRRQVSIPAAGVATVTFPIRQEAPGLTVLRAAVDAPPEIAEFGDIGAGTVVTVTDEPRLLVVTDAGSPFDTRSYQTSTMRPAQFPRSAAPLSAFDGVVLDDVDNAGLLAPQRRALAQYVEQGGGLFVLGGRRSLVPAPATDDPLAAVLPIDLSPRRGQRAPGLALVIVFDKSGSMDDRLDGAPKIEFARQAVQRVLASLPPTDALGVIAFDAAPVDVVPLQPGHDAERLAERLRAIRPSGSTAIAPALERAVGWLRSPAAAGYQRRVVLLVSDGRTSPADAARAAAVPGAPTLTVSTIALGDEADRALLQTLARQRGGRAFFPEHINELPALVAREAMRASGGRVVEERFTVRPVAHPILDGLDGPLPALRGYVVSAAKPNSEVTLQSHLGDPILALGRYGLGKVAVYTAELRSEWSSELRAWPQSGALMTRTLRWATRQLDDRALHATFTARDGRLDVRVDARDEDGQFMSALRMTAETRTPSGATTPLMFRATAPGVYDASMPLTDEGAYLFAITGAGNGTERRAARGFYWTPAGERPAEPNVEALRALARDTGGRELGANDDPFEVGRQTTWLDLRPWLALAALACVLADVLGLGRTRPRRRPATAAAQRQAA